MHRHMSNKPPTTPNTSFFALSISLFPKQNTRGRLTNPALDLHYAQRQPQQRQATLNDGRTGGTLARFAAGGSQAHRACFALLCFHW